MTQFELGERLNYSDKAISKWERAESIPDVYILKQMSEIFEVSVDYMLKEHDDDEKENTPLSHHNHKIITLISLMGVWTLATAIFIVFWIVGEAAWLIFVYTVPISLIVLLVLNSVWSLLKSNFYIISALVWSILATIYLTFIPLNMWQLFLIGIPAQVIIYLCFRIIIKK